MEDRSKNTRENAVNTAEIVRAWLSARRRRHERVSTRRGRWAALKKVGLDVDWDPVDYRGYARGWQPMSFAPRAKYLDTSVAALREHSGRAIYRARGYSE